MWNLRVAREQKRAETDGMDVPTRCSNDPLWIGFRDTLTDIPVGLVMEEEEGQNCDTIQAAKLLSPMGNETRLRLLIALCDAEQSLNNLVIVLGCHLRTPSIIYGQLRRAHVVRRRRLGHATMYICDDEDFLQILATLSKLAWQRRELTPTARSESGLCTDTSLPMFS